MVNPKQRLKSFFKNRTMSEHGVEFLRMWGLPFLKLYDPISSVDDALAAFFNIDKRNIADLVAKRNFKMPGEVALASGGKWSRRKGVTGRDVTKGSKMVAVFDSKDQTAKVDVQIEGKWKTFRLERYEVEFLKDQVEWKR